MKKIFLTLAIAGLFISGCAHRDMVKPTDQAQQQKQTADTNHKQANDQQMNKGIPQETVSSKDSSFADSQRLKELQAGIRDIHFDFDKYVIKSNEKPILKDVADTLRKNGKLKVTIEGNCDEKGTAEYNLALGDRRAVAAKEYLLSQGIEAERMDTVSNGKEKPLCTASNETCWSKNRRDHFVLEAGKH